MAHLEEITGIYITERHRFSNDGGDVIIATIRMEGGDANQREPVVIKGPAEYDELTSQLSYRFYGRWTEYKNKRTGDTERQFAFQTFVRQAPHGRAGIIRYLQSAPNIGLGRATVLWDKFNSDAVRILREQPDVAAAAIGGGFSVLKADDAAAYLREESAMESCTIDLIDLLGGRGFPKSVAKSIVKRWGNRAAGIVRRNPYLLMAFRGCGFKKTDNMYLDLGLPPAKLKRQALSAWYSLASDTEGHTWYPIEVAVNGIKANVGGVELQPEKALALAKRAEFISTLRTDRQGKVGGQPTDGGRLWVAEGKKARSEASVAASIADAIEELPIWGQVLDHADFLAADGEQHQREKIAMALSGGTVASLGGSPGCGKTYAAAAMIKALASVFGLEQIAVAAPTGKAAVRISEALTNYQLPIKARTIHSLLGVAAREDGSGWTFTHDETNPLPFKFIVVDESSMIDTDLMRSLLAARAVGTHILFVGDINQLPPVGHGAPLRDLIRAGIPYGELREVRRNSGMIVEVCAKIRDRQPWSDCEQIDIAAGENLKVLPAYTPDEQINVMLHALRQAASNGLDPVWECQVLVPVNAKSQISRKELNTVLQDALNQSPGVAGTPFRRGDKIVNTKNGFFPLDDDAKQGDDLTTNDDGKVFVANGELAEVFSVSEKLTTAKLSSPTRIIKIPRGAKPVSDDDSKSDNETESTDDATSTGCTWDLGYALSVHKSQGSEWPLAIVMIDEYPGARKVCSREWIYTGISRAKKLCLLIGKQSTAAGFCQRQALNLRKTFLAELIEQAKVDRAVENSTMG